MGGDIVENDDQQWNELENSMPGELFSGLTLGTPDESWLSYMRQLRADFARLIMEYSAGVNEVMTKIGILR